jgi:hypothetical protein
MKQVNAFKTHTKANFLRKILKEQLEYTKSIRVSYGKTEIVTLKFKNPFQTEKQFKIKINDKTIGKDQPKEVSIIQEPLEWKSLCDTRGYDSPLDFTMFLPEEDFE